MTYEGMHQFYSPDYAAFYGSFVVYQDAFDGLWYWIESGDDPHGPWPHAWEAYDDAMASEGREVVA